MFFSIMKIESSNLLESVTYHSSNIVVVSSDSIGTHSGLYHRLVSDICRDTRLYTSYSAVNSFALTVADSQCTHRSDLLLHTVHLVLAGSARYEHVLNFTEWSGDAAAQETDEPGPTYTEMTKQL